MEEKEKSDKPQKGTWSELQSFPKSITFQVDIPVKIKFADDFEAPEEVESTDSKSVYYRFPCTIEGTDRVLNASAWSLLRGLKSREPLAGQELLITLKNIKGKKQYYINVAGEFGSDQVEAMGEKPLDSGMDEEGTL